MRFAGTEFSKNRRRFEGKKPTFVRLDDRNRFETGGGGTWNGIVYTGFFERVAKPLLSSLRNQRDDLRAGGGGGVGERAQEVIRSGSSCARG